MHEHDHARREYLVHMLSIGAALALPGLAHGGPVGDLQGEVRVNGKRASRSTQIKVGDTVSTGRRSRIVFVVNDNAYLLRERSRLTVHAPTPVATWLRLVTGALLGVFARGREHTVATPAVTAGVRGTGLYASVHGPNECYFCTCYGEVALETLGGQSEVVAAEHHAARLITLQGAGGTIAAAPMRDHTDEELVMLESLVGRRPPFA